MGGQLKHTRVILLIEPKSSLCSIMRDVLVKKGFTVVTASNGNEACKLLETLPILDLLITDITLPDSSGLSVCRKARRKQPFIRVLYLSAMDEEVLRQYGVGEGASILEKPFTLTELVSRVNNLIGEGNE